jgi:hypothetical protein
MAVVRIAPPPIREALLTAGNAGRAPEDPSPSRLLRRWAFGVEVWVDGEDAPRIVGTRVVDLETTKADAWSGWSSARLLTFMESRLTPGQPPDPPAPADLPTPAGVAPRASGDLVHRYGLLTAAALVAGRNEIAARVRLNPARLDLPVGQTSAARVELFAQPAGSKRTVALDGRLFDLSDGAVDAVLRGRIAGLDQPVRVLATVRVLVDRPVGSPKDDLGGATLDVVG